MADWTIKLRCGHVFRVQSTPDLTRPLICSEGCGLVSISLAERFPDEDLPGFSAHAQAGVEAIKEASK